MLLTTVPRVRHALERPHVAPEPALERLESGSRALCCCMGSPAPSTDEAQLAAWPGKKNLKGPDPFSASRQEA